MSGPVMCIFELHVTVTVSSSIIPFKLLYVGLAIARAHQSVHTLAHCCKVVLQYLFLPDMHTVGNIQGFCDESICFMIMADCKSEKTSFHRSEDS